ncbi:MAG TPA: hypothetical protein VFF63_04715 [Candidatus Babeliales bacterium]|nr:hypothetical protein [Candidatus Babeliales bacterium]
MSEATAYWLFGLALGAALTAAIGRNFIDERGAKAIPALCAVALLLGLLIGWAINGYVAYVRASAELR